MTDQRLSNIWRILISAVVGIGVSFSLAQMFFDLNSRGPIDQGSWVELTAALHDSHSDHRVLSVDLLDDLRRLW